MYLLTKQHYSYRAGGRPVLLSCDKCTGPFGADDRLAFAADTDAASFVQRHVLNELKRTDPPLEVDEGALKEEYCLEWMLGGGVSQETRQLARLLTKLEARGIEYEKFIGV